MFLSVRLLSKNPLFMGHFSYQCTDWEKLQSSAHRKYECDSLDHNGCLFVSTWLNCKCILNKAKLLFVDKMRCRLASHKFGFHSYWQLCKSMLSKGQSWIPHLFNQFEVLSSTSDKAEWRTGACSEQLLGCHQLCLPCGDLVGRQ